MRCIKYRAFALSLSLLKCRLAVRLLAFVFIAISYLLGLGFLGVLLLNLGLLDLGSKISSNEGGVEAAARSPDENSGLGIIDPVVGSKTMLSGSLSCDDSPSSSISITSLSFFLRLREPPADLRLPPAGGLNRKRKKIIF